MEKGLCGQRKRGPTADRVRIQSQRGLGCHWHVAFIPKKYSLSPSSRPGSGLGVDKDGRDVLCHPRLSEGSVSP